MNKTLLSIIIPVWNQEELIIRALKSIPPRDDIEVIVINDGSTDRTHEVVKDFIYHSPLYIKFISYQENKGVSHALNMGIEVANGEYLDFAGSDDYFYTDELIKALDELDGTDLVYYDMSINDGSLIKSIKGKHPHGSVKFMRREFVGDIRNREDLKAAEDYYFTLELYKKKPTEKFTGIVMKHYNYPREGSLSNLVLKGKLEGIKK